MDDPILWLTIALFVSLATNGILGFALHTCLPRARASSSQLESQPTRTDDGVPEFGLLSVSDDAWNEMKLKISREPTMVYAPEVVAPAKTPKPKRGKKGKMELVKS